MTEGKHVEVYLLNETFQTQNSNKNSLVVSLEQIQKEVADKSSKKQDHTVS